MIPIFASIIFIIGYILITLEHKLRLSKSAIALATGGILWMLVPLVDNSHFREELLHSSAEIFEIVVFLLAAMSLVEILVHYRFFDIIRSKIYALKLNQKNQFVIISVFTFFLSAIVDNLTTTIVMTQISRRFFVGANMLRAVAGVIIAANAGGAWSPLGDVTTIMLWLANKFSASEIILQGFIPSLTMLIVMVLLLYRSFTNKEDDSKDEMIKKLGRSEKIVIASVFGSFTLPIVVSQLGLPPYLGLLLGLGIVWIIVDVFKQIRPKETHLNASIDDFIKNTDIPSLKFFIGILLAVSALQNLQILETLSQLLYGAAPTFERMIFANVGMGFLSAILDNVPLTAMAIDMVPTENTSLWVLLALAVGTGGSLLVIGSAAGVIAMGMVKELHFGNYLKIAFVPALVSFLTGMSVWYIQYLLINSL